MCAQQQSEQQRVGEFSPPGVSLRGLIRWRFGVAAAALITAAAVTVWGVQEGTKGCMSLFLLMGALLLDAILLPLFVLPSWIIARSLTRRPRPAVWLALIHDLLILILAILMVVFISLNTNALELLTALNSPPLWLGLALALTFGAEAAYLLRMRWQWRPAWPVFGLLAAGLVATAALIPAFVTARKARDVRPLLGYVTSHWVRIPPRARVSIAGQCRAAPHPHTIHVQAEHTLCWISAEHVRDGRWTCTRGLERPGGGGVGFGTFFLRSEPVRGVGSADGAKELLRQCGVVDTGLSFERATKEHDRSEYVFRSLLGQGRYRVNHFGHINFYLQRPLGIP